MQPKLTLSNLIYIEKAGFSHAALNTIKRMAAFSNPEFRLKQSMRLPVYNTPRIVDCSYEDHEYIGIPRGCMDTLAELLEGYGIPFIVDDFRCTGRPINVSFKGALRTEQEPAAQALLTENIGVLSATTAFGKTVIGAWLIGQRKTNTLILVWFNPALCWNNGNPHLSSFWIFKRCCRNYRRSAGERRNCI